MVWHTLIDRTYDNERTVNMYTGTQACRTLSRLTVKVLGRAVNLCFSLIRSHLHQDGQH